MSLLLTGRVVKGTQAASGLQHWQKEGGTIRVQKPFFVKAGINLDQIHFGTINVCIVPREFAIQQTDYYVPQVQWDPNNRAECFSFYDFSNMTAKSWEYPANMKMMVALLRQAKLYIGTDTGPTQLAVLTKTPMILFRYWVAGNPDLLQNIVLPISQQQHIPVQIISDGWEKPAKVAAAALRYLSQNVFALPRG